MFYIKYITNVLIYMYIINVLYIYLDIIRVLFNIDQVFNSEIVCSLGLGGKTFYLTS